MVHANTWRSSAARTASIAEMADLHASRDARLNRNFVVI
jgi:hypothetical protein